MLGFFVQKVFCSSSFQQEMRKNRFSSRFFFGGWGGESSKTSHFGGRNFLGFSPCQINKLPGNVFKNFDAGTSFL